MNGEHSNEYSYLDQIRINEGSEKCKSTLSALVQKDTGRAATLLNDNRLRFPCLYVLHEPLRQQRIQRHLNARNITALRITNQIKGANTSNNDYLSPKQNTVYPVLKWILETGSAEDILEDDYEEILDVTVSVLINNYKEKEILPLVVDLIFKRNRNGSHIHDLVWALFRFHDPVVLKLIAPYLRSSDQKDTELANELLNLDQPKGLSVRGDGEKQYDAYLRWLENNEAYLFFTEESFQFSSKPLFCDVDLERKYLQKHASSYDKQPLSVLDTEEKECLTAFKQLRSDEQKVLSDYSHTLCSKSEADWKEWLHKPVPEQMNTAKARWEGEK